MLNIFLAYMEKSGGNTEIGWAKYYMFVYEFKHILLLFCCTWSSALMCDGQRSSL